REVYFIDPDRLDEETEALALLAARIPMTFVNTTGLEEIVPSIVNTGSEWRSDPLGGRSDFNSTVARFGQPKGICAAAADSPVDSLKAATLAVRLGFYFIALSVTEYLPLASVKDLPLIWIGSANSLENIVEPVLKEKWTIIEDDCQMLSFMENSGLASDYLVLYNSADLMWDTDRGESLGELWTKGLSLQLLILASYRPVFPFDAQSEEPDPQVIEKNMQTMVRQTGLKPRFQVVLASPATIPFFYAEKKGIGSVTEEMIRDIHLRLNADLLFDLAEGRLMQNSCGGVSAQLISTKRFKEIQSYLNRSGRDVLIVATPHVETGIIFSTDDALIDAQLTPLLKDAGFNVRQLRDRDAHYKKVSSALAETDFFLYTGHGGPEGLHTHGRSLERLDLPLLPPLVAYASACSTVGLVPYWYSTDEGLTWEGVPVDSRQVIGLSFVEKGAICFVGGATIEDLQYTTSTYSVFMEALLLKGLSVGEAVQEMRHVISLHALTLLQKNPEAYRKYRWGTANALHQQVLLGDPAFVPVCRKHTGAAMPASYEGAAPLERLTVEIPEERWQRSSATVQTMEASKYYYRCRYVEEITPYGEDIFSWGDYYRVAPDARNISETAVKSSFLHLSHDLPPGMAPRSLTLVDAEAGEGECLLCGEEAYQLLTPVEAMRKFKLPYLLQPPIELNMEKGWAFISERTENFIRIRWLAPLLLIDEVYRSAIPLKKFTFQIESEPEVLIKGKITNHEPDLSYMVCAGYYEEDRQIKGDIMTRFNCTAAALTGEDGTFELSCTPETVLIVQEQYPLYELPEKFAAFRRTVYTPDQSGTAAIELEPVAKVKLDAHIYDSLTGEALPGALIRVFRGEHDPVGDVLIEAYAAETITGSRGEFSLDLPAGNYLLYAVAAPGARRYKSAEWVLKLREGEKCNRVYALDQAGIVRGRITFEGYKPPEPPVIELKRFPNIEGSNALSKLPARRDGSYECLVSYQDRFQVIIEEEGRQYIYDNDEGNGYRLEPQEVLERDYCLRPDPGQEE
ncbi:MAG TPA: C25 family cysteine peptidase, partial [Candidatus Limnocylindrales bacterium]|nr:C25 family cysteine peptidase [Candidatus Limnocylindrales bacterium]